MDFFVKISKIFLIGGMLSLGILAKAQGEEKPKLTISTNADTIGLDSDLKFTITLENGPGYRIQEPYFENFEVVGGPMQSSQTTVINGEMSSKKSMTFTLRPKQKGAFLIEPAKASKGGEELRTDYYAIWVVPEGMQPALQENEAEGNSFFFRFGGPGFESPNPPTPPTPPKKKRKIYKL